MFEFVHKIYFNCTENKQSGFEHFSTCGSFDIELINQLKKTIKDDYPVIIINAHVDLPPFWEQRLLQPMVENDEVKLISSLNVTDHQLSPIAADVPGTLSQLDQTIYLLQTAQYFQSEKVNPHCFAFRNIQQIGLDSPSFAVNNLVIDTTKTNGTTKAPLFPDVGDQHPLPAHPLATLHLKLEEVKQPPSPVSYPVLDQKPVALHVVMDWGGGVHQWVNNYIEQHTEYNHLVWVSHGEFFRFQHGERFSLHWAGTNGICIDQYHLSDPIKSTAIHHPEYTSLLNDLIQRWPIQLVVVSSLIGHAMDCLNTGISTLRVLHDYFPHWPLLNAALENNTINASDIDKALVNSKSEPFGEITAEQLILWQKAQNNLLSQPNINIVAPDSSVKRNLLKLPHSDVFNKTAIIPHATDQLNPIDYAPVHSPFKVLVLGRVSQPKGQGLISACIKALEHNNDVQFILLGAGIHGKTLASFENVTVIENYEHDQLTENLNKFSPQLALLASTTSETFSYTLSELLMSGIPVLATKTGAFKSRIVDGKNGLLIEASSPAFIEKITSLSNNPELLSALHEGALNSPHINQKENKKAFQKLLTQTSINTEYHTKGLLAPAPLTKMLQGIRNHRDWLNHELSSSQDN